MKLLLIKSKNGCIYPCHEQDRTLFKKIKSGEFFTAEIVKPRSIMHHRKFFALLNLVVENSEIYRNTEDLRFDLMLEMGFYDTYVNFLGEVVKKPRSISFAAMDQAEFDLFYEKAVDTIIQHFSWDKESLLEEIAQYF